MKLRKRLQYRMLPNRSQRVALARNAGARRWVWNWALARKREYYARHGVELATSVLQKELPLLKQQPETAWLKTVDAQSLQVALRDLDQAYRNFFAKRARLPLFKSRKRDQPRFCIPQRVLISDGAVYVPKVGHVRIRESRPVEGKTKGGTFKLDTCGNWNLSLVSEFEMSDASLPGPDPAGVVGVDLGLKYFAVLNNGQRVDVPQFYRKTQQALRKAQRVFSRRKSGSARRQKARRAVAVVHRKIVNRRSDFLHKLTTGFVKKYEGICIEDLNVMGLAKTKLAKSINDAAFGNFRRQLEYKTVWNRKHLVVIDRWYPSSKTCHKCGALNAALTLADRHWTCVCGLCHDRDLNAALNIRSEGLKLLVAAGHAETENARGPDVRLPQLEAIGVEA